MTVSRGNILFVSSQPFFQWRGSSIRVGFDVQALADLGFQVDLLTLPVGEPREINGVRVIRVPNLIGVKNVAIGPSLVKLFFDALLLFRALALSRATKYSFVHTVEDTGPVGVAVAAFTKSKLVFEKHSDPASYRRGFLRNAVMAAYARVEAFTMRRADAVIGTGPGLVEQAKRAAPGKPVHHIFDIPSSLKAADADRIRQVRARLDPDGNNVLVTYVGSFALYQGVNLLFEALPLVAAAHKHVRFVVIGGTPDEIADRRNRLTQLGLGEAVLFTGKIHPDELPSYLSASDILLSPRIAGTNTPLKLLDYLKAGRAIVATNHEANRQILDEQSAVLVEPSARGFAEGIRTLIKDPDTRRRLGERGVQLVRERYNYEEFKKRLNVCYSDLEQAGNR